AAAAQSRKSRYAVVRSPGTATVLPRRSSVASEPLTSSSGPQPRPSAPPQPSSSYLSSSHGRAAYDTLTRSNLPSSAAVFVTSTSAYVTSIGGAPSTNPCTRAWKTNVSFGQGEMARDNGCAVTTPTYSAPRQPESARLRHRRSATRPGRADLLRSRWF